MVLAWVPRKPGKLRLCVPLLACPAVVLAKWPKIALLDKPAVAHKRFALIATWNL